MKKKTLKLICLVLCLCSVLAILAACKDNGTKDPESTPSDTQPSGDEDGYEYDENGYVKDTINRTLVDTDIRILMDSSSKNDVMPDEADATNDVVAMQSYYRRLELEARLGCTTEIITAPGEYKGMTDFIQAAEKAGDSGIDLICAFSLVPPQLAKRGLLTNLNNLQYPELDMPWWPESIQEWQHNGALYYVSNNSSNRVVRAQEVVFADTKMINNKGLDPLEEIVLDGKWTLDLMLTYAKYVTTDMDAAPEERVYGLAIDDQSRADQFFYGAGLEMTKLNADGEVELTLDDTAVIQKTISVIDKLGTIASYSEFFVDTNNESKLMADNRTMFMAGYMNMITLIDNQSGYIPLPTPKYDEEQKEYYTTPHNSYDVWCIPVSCKNKEDAGVVIEAIASSDYRDLAPFFYEEKLKLRYSEDANGAEIFDLIRNATHVGFGRINSESIDILETHFRRCFYRGGAQTFVSDYATSMNENQKNTYKIKFKTLLISLEKYKDQ